MCIKKMDAISSVHFFDFFTYAANFSYSLRDMMPISHTLQ